MRIIENLKKTHEGYSFTEVTANKANGIVLNGICVRKDGDDVGVNVYVDPVKDKTESEIAEYVWESYTEDRGHYNLPIDELSKWEYAKERIQVRVANSDANREFLADKPSAEYLDLAVYLAVEVSEYPYMSFNVDESHLKMWGVDFGTAYQKAMGNLAKRNSIVPIEDMILTQMKESDADMPEDFQFSKTQTPMYVMTNRARLYGASAIMDTEALESLASELETKALYVFPSSVHEIIVIPDDGGVDVEQLKSMVCDINRTQVALEIYLSDSVYRYEHGEVSIAA